MFLQKVRSHLTLANVLSLTALFVALGGTALGAVIITDNSQVAKGTISGHRPPAGDHPNLIGGTINDPDVRDLSFQQLTLTNGWVGNCVGGGHPAIAKGVEGVVYFRGEMCNPSALSSHPFTVPAGFEPSKPEHLVVNQIAGRTGELIIDNDGTATVLDDADHPGSGADRTVLSGTSYTLPF